MTSISWPIILSGDYSDGSVCNAADYKNDFYKLRDAVNQIYERFGSYRLSATIRRPLGYTDYAADASTFEKSVRDYITIIDTYYESTTLAQEGPTGSADESRRRVVRALIQVPTWMQGVRIRGLQASNTSQFPYFLTAGGGDDRVDFKTPLTYPNFGVSVGADIEDFDWRDGATSFNSGSGAVDVATVSFGNENGDGAGILNDTVLYPGGAGQSYTAKNYVGGPNWSVFGGQREYRPVMKAVTADYVVEPGSFIGLWASGSVTIYNETGATLEGPAFIEYSWDVLLDAMIPIP
jgi:hypothetical protein